MASPNASGKFWLPAPRMPSSAGCNALVDYAGLGPLRRAELAASIVLDPVAGRGFSKVFPLQVEVVEALEQAIIDDRRKLGRMVSRAGFVREAVTHAAQRARQRADARPAVAPGTARC